MGEIGEIGKYVAHASLKWHSRPTLSLLFHQRGTSQSESVGWSERPSVGRRCPCQNECGCQLKSTIISSSSALKRRETVAAEAKIKIEFGNGTPERLACHGYVLRSLLHWEVSFPKLYVQGGWGGWPTGNGKKVSNSQVCCLAQLCLAAA